MRSDSSSTVLLTILQTAEWLNLKPSTIRAWLAEGRLPKVHCGRCVRVPVEAVLEFIARNTTPAREDRCARR